LFFNINLRLKFNMLIILKFFEKNNGQRNKQQSLLQGKKLELIIF